MPISLPGSGGDHAAPRSRLHRFTAAIIWINAISVTILVGGELFALSAALDWALAGLLHLAGNINYVRIAALFAPSALATWAIFGRALAAERELAQLQAAPPVSQSHPI